MKLSYEDHDTVSVMTVSGDLTADQADGFRRACQDRFDASIRDIVLDMEYLATIDSAGLELLLWLSEQIGSRGGHLKIVKPDETIRTILNITRLERRFDVHDSIEAAAGARTRASRGSRRNSTTAPSR
jgi:anti-sigma B factor antagonist